MAFRVPSARRAAFRATMMLPYFRPPAEHPRRGRVFARRGRTVQVAPEPHSWHRDATLTLAIPGEDSSVVVPLPELRGQIVVFWGPVSTARCRRAPWFRRPPGQPVLLRSATAARPAPYAEDQSPGGNEAA